MRRPKDAWKFLALSARPYTEKEVLQTDKYQPYGEKRHALLKNELEVAPVYLKRPQRVVGLLHAHFLGMVLGALIECTGRISTLREGIESLPILPEGRPTNTRTAARILEKFTGIHWYESDSEGDRHASGRAQGATTTAPAAPRTGPQSLRPSGPRGREIQTAAGRYVRNACWIRSFSFSSALVACPVCDSSARASRSTRGLEQAVARRRQCFK